MQRDSWALLALAVVMVLVAAALGWMMANSPCSDQVRASFLENSWARKAVAGGGRPPMTARKGAP